MYFAIKAGKVVLAHRNYETVAACPHDSIAEKDESLLANAAYPERLKVVAGEVVDKTDTEIAADAEAARIASIKEIRKRHIRLRLRELGKEDAADAILNDPANARIKKDWLDSVSIKIDDADFLSLLSALGVSINQILEGYEG